MIVKAATIDSCSFNPTDSYPTFRLIGWPAVAEAQVYQVVEARGPGTHHSIRTTPVDFYTAVVIRDCTTGKNDVVYVARDLPGILRGQHPFVRDADNLRRIGEIMQRHTEAIDRPVHGLEHPVVDAEPAALGADRGRTGTDLRFVPMIRHWFQHHLHAVPVSGWNK